MVGVGCGAPPVVLVEAVGVLAETVVELVVVVGLVEEGCFATRGPFLVTPSPPHFLRRSLKLAASILLSLLLSLPALLTAAGEERSPKLLRL